MSEVESSPETQPKVEKITYGDCVIYTTNIHPKSEWTSIQNEAQQLQALTEIAKKVKNSKEKIVGTALLSTATGQDWPVTRLRSTLVVIGSSPLTHPREPQNNLAKQEYQAQISGDTMIGTTTLTPEWKNLYKGTVSKNVLIPVAHFADEAMQKLGKNINVSVSLPNLGAWTAYMMATRRSEIFPVSIPQLKQPIL